MTAFRTNFSRFLVIFIQSALLSAVQTTQYDAELDYGRQGSFPVIDFVSSTVKAPRANWARWSPECDDGLSYFLTPKGWKVASPGPAILDSNGSLIWTHHFDNEFGGQAYDLKVQRYKGNDVLTFWSGDDRIKGHGFGKYYMLNSSYEVVGTITAAKGVPVDLHELLITPQGTALVSFFDVVPGDLGFLGRTNAWNQYIWDSVFQEINIETQEVLFEWRASAHVNVSTTYREASAFTFTEGSQQDPIDWFHLNSIEKDDDGNFLISARYPHSVYYIDGKTGDIIWTLGGKSNMFMDLSKGHALNFAWQHDARFHSASDFPQLYSAPSKEKGVTTRLLTLFDNSQEDHDRTYHYGPSYSRGLLLELRYPTPGTKVNHQTPASSRKLPTVSLPDNSLREPLGENDLEKLKSINGSNPYTTVRIVQEFINPDTQLNSLSQGSLQVIPSRDSKSDSSVLVGYGLASVVSRFNSQGSMICDLHFGARTGWQLGHAQSYRAFKSAWKGYPRYAPLIKLKNNQIYVSWNGATEVKQWLLQASNPNSKVDQKEKNSPKEWSEVAIIPKQGFETTIDVPKETITSSRYFRVIALDSENSICPNGISQTIDRGYVHMLISPHTKGNYVSVVEAIFVSLAVIVTFVLIWKWRSPKGYKRGEGIIGNKRAID